MEFFEAVTLGVVGMSGLAAIIVFLWHEAKSQIVKLQEKVDRLDRELARLEPFGDFLSEMSKKGLSQFRFGGKR